MKTGKWFLYASLSVAGIISFILDSRLNSLISSAKNAEFDAIFGLFSNFAFLTLLFIAVVSILLFTKKNKQLIKASWAFVIGFLVSHILKLIIQRTRPFSNEKELFLTKLPDYSFPSSHAVVAFAMLPILMTTYPKYRWLFAFLAAMIAFSRYYLGLHYLSDVIFGTLIGLLISQLIMRK